MRQHGTRAKYVVDKCRCLPCRAANSRYAERLAKLHAAGRTPFVSADKAREHLLWLAEEGVGLRQVSAESGVGRTALTKIRSGRVTRIRPATGRRIVAVRPSATADGALVDAAPTWVLINHLLEQGYTRTWIAKQLGSTAKVPALQVGRDRCLASTARQVRRLAQDVADGQVAA